MGAAFVVLRTGGCPLTTPSWRRCRSRLGLVVDGPDIRNEAVGKVLGPVVQAGMIHQIFLAASPNAEQRVVPRQLPLAVRDFTGRADYLIALDRLLTSEDDTGGAGTAVISAVGGSAGIGKTTLAVHWAHRVQHHFPDGTLYVNLHGYGPDTAVKPGEVLDGFLHALGTPPERMPTGVEAQSGLYRSLLAGRRMLVVLDNANSPEQIRPLLPAGPRCMVIVTSRASLTGLVITEGASRLTLDLLTEPEARELVSGIIGRRAEAEPEAVLDLIRLCARLPLALRIAASRIAAHPYTMVADIVAELSDDHRRLDMLSQTGDERSAVRAVFDWSYQRLRADQARLFRRLGLHPGPDLSLHAAAAIAGLVPAETRRLLNMLAETHLIEQTAADRYRFHDLLRAYAADQARKQDSARDLDQARESVLTWYAHTAYLCDELAFPAHHRLPLRLIAPVPLTSISGRSQALDWLTVEQANLLAALRQAADLHLHHHVFHLAESTRFLFLLGSRDKRLHAVNAALAEAHYTGDRAAKARFRNFRCNTFWYMRHWEEAWADARCALTLARDLDDRLDQVSALAYLGLLCCEQDRFEEALQYLNEALPLSRNIDTGRSEAVVLANLSDACMSIGRYHQAINHGERDVALRRRIADLDGEVGALVRLARARQGLDQHEMAIALCREAMAIMDKSVYFGTVAKLFDTLAVSLYRTGETTEAIAFWREAVRLFDDYGVPHQAPEVRDRLAQALHKTSQAGGTGTVNPASISSQTNNASNPTRRHSAPNPGGADCAARSPCPPDPVFDPGVLAVVEFPPGGLTGNDPLGDVGDERGDPMPVRVGERQLGTGMGAFARPAGRSDPACR